MLVSVEELDALESLRGLSSAVAAAKEEAWGPIVAIAFQSVTMFERLVVEEFFS